MPAFARKCARCANEIGVGAPTCAQCGAPSQRLQAAFARAEEAYVALRQRYDAGSLPADQFKAAVEGAGEPYEVGIDRGARVRLDAGDPEYRRDGRER